MTDESAVTEPYWRLITWHDGIGGKHQSWQPSEEMLLILGQIMSQQHHIEEAMPFVRPNLILFPVNKVPEGETEGWLFGIPFLATDKVTVPSLCYPVDQP